jgi:hypothetical protein
MIYRLINIEDPNLTFGLTSSTWYGILELAEENGWNPMGTMPPNPDEAALVLAGLSSMDAPPWDGEYWNDDGGLVLFEDALNLADALEQALLQYEPQYIPSLYYYTVFGENNGYARNQPGLGAIQGMIDFCYTGSFKIVKA